LRVLECDKFVTPADALGMRDQLRGQALEPSALLALFEIWAATVPAPDGHIAAWGWRECPCEDCQDCRDTHDEGGPIFEVRPEYQHLIVSRGVLR
jgi:hypothetical protein